MTILRKVAAMVREQSLVGQGDRVVVGVSGGADSVALLRLLSLLPHLELSLVVAHVNHRLRGEAAERDELFVRRLAEKLGLPCEVERADVAEVARSRGLSLEEAGREVRYAFFRRVRQRQGARCIAVAHTADDQAETVLMRLLRGTGPDGAAGMEPVTVDGVVRPLLSCRRAEVVSFLRSLGQEWCEDESNEDQAFLRNRIRHGVLPLLEEINPQVREALCQFSRLLADDEAYLASRVEEEFNRLAAIEPSCVRLETSPLLELPRTLRYRLIRRALRQVRGDLRRISLRHVEAVERLMTAVRPNAFHNLPGAVALQAYGVLTIARSLPAAWDAAIAVPGPGDYLLPDGSCLLVMEGGGPDAPLADGQTITVDAEAAPFPWELRPFSPGDRLFLAGLGGHKKVKKLFMEERVPLLERRQIPLLLCGTEVLWVCGIRRSDTARPLSAGGTEFWVVYTRAARPGQT